MKLINADKIVVKITSQVRISGQRAAVGTVLRLPRLLALDLIYRQRAERSDEEPDNDVDLPEEDEAEGEPEGAPGAPGGEKPKGRTRSPREQQQQT